MLANTTHQEVSQLFTPKQLVETGNETLLGQWVSFVREMERRALGWLHEGLDWVPRTFASIEVWKRKTTLVSRGQRSCKNPQQFQFYLCSVSMGIEWCRNHSRSHELLSSVALPDEFTWVQQGWCELLYRKSQPAHSTVLWILLGTRF